jgi:hypothetical protein
MSLSPDNETENRPLSHYPGSDFIIIRNRKHIIFRETFCLLGRVGNFAHAVARTSVKCQVFLSATDPRKDHYTGHSLRIRLSRVGMNAHPTTEQIAKC